MGSDDVKWLEKRPWKVAMCPVGALVSLRRQSADGIRQSGLIFF